MTRVSTVGYLSAAMMLLWVAGTSGPANASTAFFHPGTSVGGTWSATGSLHTARVSPMAATLTSGKVLVAGGFNASATLASAELYDPATGRWSPTGAMLLGRYTATMTVLTNGKVLVAGGRFNGSPGVTTEAELYDPATGKWSSTGAMTAPRASHTATLLANGKVLVAGGVGVQQADSIASAELYDPVTGKWSNTAAMSTGRERHAATRLTNGKVLVSGGSLDYLDGAEGSAESYDPHTGAWTVVGRMMTSRFSHTATALSDGTVLVAGGSYGNFAASNAVAMTDRYDPRKLRWSPVGDMQIAVRSVPTISGREAHTATLLPNGQVLVAGGDGYLTDFKRPAVIFSTAELFDPSLGTWTLTGSMQTARAEHAARIFRSSGRDAACRRRNAGALASRERPASRRVVPGNRASRSARRPAACNRPLKGVARRHRPLAPHNFDARQGFSARRITLV